VPVEIAGIQLPHVTGLAVTDAARTARHHVPGMSGDLVQVLGRQSVEVEVRGIFYGTSAPDDLDSLRSKHDAGEPVSFFVHAVDDSDLTQTLHFSEVLITSLLVEQRAGAPEEFAFVCRVSEYVPPPAPAPAAAPGLGGGLGDALGGLDTSALDAVDTSLLDEAMSAVDGLQDALAAVGDLTDLLTNMPSFGDPTTRLPEMLKLFQPLAEGGAGTLGDVRDAIEPPAA
jgi:hypothetical protein